jgi:hypothetical protein
LFIDWRFKIGGVVIGLVDPGGPKAFSVEDRYLPFLTADSPDVVLESHWGVLPDLKGWDQAFDTQGVWKLYRSGEKMALELSAPSPGPTPYQVAVLDPNFRAGAIYSRQSPNESEGRFPLAYPLAEVLMIHLLAQGRGVLMHACGVQYGQVGLLFSGVSGAGKSTTARLWKGQLDAHLLSDDRIIIRRHGSEYKLYGTPWHGDARIVSPDSAPLQRIYILHHAPSNKIQRLDGSEALTSLVVRSFPTFWYPQGMQFTLQFLGEMCQTIPVYHFGFVPDMSAVDFIKSHLLKAEN